MDYVLDELRDDRGGLADRADDAGAGRQGQAGAPEGGGATPADGGLRSTAAGARAVPALGAARRRWGEDVIKALLILAALISVLTTTGIVIALLRETIDFFGDVGLWEFLSGGKWTPLFEPPSFGVRPLVIGHLPDHGHRAGRWPRRSASAPRST